MDRDLVKAKQRRVANSGALGRVLERLSADGGRAGEGARAEAGGGVAPEASRPPERPGSTGPVEIGASARMGATKPRFFPSRGPARVPAEVCRPWDLADRPENEFEHLEELVRSFQNEGQLQPVVVRPVEDAARPEIRYEVIAGQARWRAARKAGIELDVLVRGLDDEAAFRAMVGENEFRRGLSDHAKARRLALSLERGLYKDKSALAQAVGMSPSQLSYFLGFAELDPVVVARFQRVQDVSARLGYALHLAVREGFLREVLKDLPRIESGEIKRDQIPGIWREGGATAQGGAPVAVVATGPVVRTAARRFTDQQGRLLFTLLAGGRRGSVLRVPAELSAGLDDGCWNEIAQTIARRRGGDAG